MSIVTICNLYYVEKTRNFVTRMYEFRILANFIPAYNFIVPVNAHLNSWINRLQAHITAACK